MTDEHMKKELDFYSQLSGLQICESFLFVCPEIENMVGLDMRVSGEHDNWFGRIEPVGYQKASGNNRYPNAVAPAPGALHVIYSVNDTVSFKYKPKN